MVTFGKDADAMSLMFGLMTGDGSRITRPLPMAGFCFGPVGPKKRAGMLAYEAAASRTTPCLGRGLPRPAFS